MTAAAPRPVPRQVLLPLDLAVCLSLFGDLALYASLVTQISVVGLSLGAVGIMLSVHRLIRIPGNPLAGLLFDRWGRRRLFVMGMLLATASTAGHGLVHGFWPFLLSRLAWGIAWTLIHVGGLSMVLDVSTPADRGRLTGLYNTWMLLGLALGPLVGGMLVDGLGFRPAMLTCAGLTALGLAVAAVALPETVPLASQSTPGPGLPPRLSNLRRQANTWLRANRGLVTASSLYGMAQFAGDGVALSTISLLLQKHFGDRVGLGELTVGIASAGGGLLALRSIIAAAVGPLCGGWSDRQLGRWPVIQGSLVIGIIGFGLLFFSSSLWVIVLGVALGAVSAGAALATLAATVGALTPTGRQGAVMGIYNAVGDIGSTAGPFVAFGLLSLVDLRWVYLICALIFLVGLEARRFSSTCAKGVV